MSKQNNKNQNDLEDDVFEDGYDNVDCFDNDDICYECGGYGDDYYVDKNGDFVCACDSCINNPNNWEDGYWIGDD